MLELQKINKTTKTEKEEEERYAAALAITQLCEGFKGDSARTASSHRQHTNTKSHVLKSEAWNLKPGSPDLDLDLSDKKSYSPAGNVSAVSSDGCSTSPLDLTIKKQNDTEHQTNLLTDKCTLNKGTVSENKYHIDILNTNNSLNVEPPQRLNSFSPSHRLTGSVPIYILNNVILANSPRFSLDTANIVALSQTLKAQHAASRFQPGAWTGQKYINYENTSQSEGCQLLPFMTVSTANSDIAQHIKVTKSTNIESQHVMLDSSSSQRPVKATACLSKLTQLLPKGLSSIAKFYKRTEVKKPPAKLHVKIRKKPTCKDNKSCQKQCKVDELSGIELKHYDVNNVPIPVLASEDFECESVANFLPSGLTSFSEFYQGRESFPNQMKSVDKAEPVYLKKVSKFEVEIKSELTGTPPSGNQNTLLPISVAEESENDVLKKFPIMRCSSQKNNIRKINTTFKNHENCIKRKSNNYAYGKTKHIKEDLKNTTPLHASITSRNIPVKFNGSDVDHPSQLSTGPESTMIPTDIWFAQKARNQTIDKMTNSKRAQNAEHSSNCEDLDMKIPLNVLKSISELNNMPVDVNLPPDETKAGITAKEGVKLCTKASGGDDAVITEMYANYLTNSDVDRKEYQHLFLSPDDDGDYPLHVAVMKGNRDVVLALADIIKRIGGDMSCRDAIRQTPLHLAIEMKHNDIVECLMEFGANPCLLDSKGRSCLHLSILHSNEIGLELMLKHHNSSKFNYDVKDYEGLTVLHLAVLKGRIAALKLLVESGAVNIDEKEGKSGKTALYLAAELNQSKTLALLLKNGASEKEADYSGYTPYQVAAMKPCSDVIKEFDLWQACKERSKLANHNTDG